MKVSALDTLVRVFFFISNTLLYMSLWLYNCVIIFVTFTILMCSVFVLLLPKIQDKLLSNTFRDFRQSQRIGKQKLFLLFLKCSANSSIKQRKKFFILPVFPVCWLKLTISLCSFLELSSYHGKCIAKWFFHILVWIWGLSWTGSQNFTLWTLTVTEFFSYL